MGRPAKSLAIHELHGTRSHVEPVSTAFIAGRPKIPSHLCKAARAEWKRCCQILEQRHTITQGEATILTLYAEIYSRWVQAKRELANELMIEITVLDNNGMPHTTRKLNPLLKVIEACESRLLALAKNMGLTPVDRERGKMTATNPGEEIVPGSVADVMPWLLNPDKVTPIRPQLESEDSAERRGHV